VASERRTETSRLEGFSDAVFAFALTLLVVSLEVPRSYDDLVHTLRSFIAFAVSFAALIWIWYLHREFFRLFGLSDGPMIVLNSILLFVVLLYVPAETWRLSCSASSSIRRTSRRSLGAAPVVAGLFYFVLGPVRPIHGARTGRHRRAPEAALITASP
jgi:hypothetical protein